MGSIHLFTLLEPSPGSGHSKTEWSSTEHVQEGALALDLRLEAKGKTAMGSQWEAPIFLRLTHLQEKSHGV